MEETVMVSVICNVFNHEKYIRRCLEGFLIQKTSFHFEVLVHDDASNDNSAAIIKEFTELRPDLFLPVYEKVNIWSKHDGSLSKLQYGRARGKYIALCEGDDFWFDEYKLQTQFDWMENNPNCDMCCHAAMIISENGDQVGSIAPSDVDCFLSVEKVIKRGGGFISTNSLFFKKQLWYEQYSFLSFLRYDYSIQIQGAMKNDIFYFSKPMSCYRKFAVGSWTESMKKDKNKRLGQYKKTIKMLALFNRDTGRRHWFSVFFRQVVLSLKILCLLLSNNE